MLVDDLGTRGAHYVAINEHYAAPVAHDEHMALGDGHSDAGVPSMRGGAAPAGRPILSRAEGAELVAAAREVRTALYATAAAVALAAVLPLVLRK